MPNYPIWSRIPKDEFIKYVNESYSLREIAQKCGYSIKNTGNYLKSIKDGAKFYNLSLDHLDGRGKILTNLFIGLKKVSSGIADL